MIQQSHLPYRGEIWFAKMPTDPPEKGPRPVIVVSVDSRNRHERADTILVIPLTTTLRESETHLRLEPGETGFSESCAARAEDVAVISKKSLLAPRHQLRRLSHQRICELASLVRIAMGCFD
jgi:mRNA-degrading endonuclease toxin of MazEF toxin-antitoxin module